jgi:hypothetical protein
MEPADSIATISNKVLNSVTIDKQSLPYSYLHLRQCSVEFLTGGGTIDTRFKIELSRVTKFLSIGEARFTQPVHIGLSQLPLQQALLFRCAFDSGLGYSFGSIDGELSIYESRIRNGLFLSDDTIRGLISISKSLIDELFAIKTSFGGLQIVNSEVTKSLLLIESTVHSRFLPAGTTFRGPISFAFTQFSNGIDLRRCNLDSLASIALEGIQFPDGQLWVDWGAIKAIDTPRIVIAVPSASAYDNFRRLESVYLKLRDNYLAQGNRQSADDVMYELEWQRERVLGGLFQWAYGFLFGYGYQAWRYAIFVVLPIVFAFAAVYHFFFFPVFAPVVDRTIPENLRAAQRERRFRRSIIHYYPTRLSGVPVLRRIFLALYFSFTVLLAFRFKKDWLTKSTRFFDLVVLQYFFGLLLYVLFAYYARGSYFDTVRNILGF